MCTKVAVKHQSSSPSSSDHLPVYTLVINYPLIESSDSWKSLILKCHRTVQGSLCHQQIYVLCCVLHQASHRLRWQTVWARERSLDEYNWTPPVMLTDSYSIFTTTRCLRSVGKACIQSRTLPLIPYAAILAPGIWCGTESNALRKSRYTTSIGSSESSISVHSSKTVSSWSYRTSPGQSYVEHHIIIDFPSYDVPGGHVLLTPWLFLVWRSDLLACNYQHVICYLSRVLAWCFQFSRRWEVAPHWVI